MKHIKHWLATIAVLLCSIAVSAHDFEVGGIYYNINSRENNTVEVTYRGEYTSSYSNEYVGTITIPETVTYNDKTYRVTLISEYAFSYCSNLTGINIPESVTSIGWNAFDGCTNITNINIPESVLSIRDFVFYNCSSLTNVTISGGVKSIGYCAFSGCSSLTNITIPEGVTTIGESAFSGCKKLTNINIPKSVVSIGNWAFSNCSNFTSVTIPENVTSIGNGAFSGCTGELFVNCNITASGNETGSGAFYNSNFTSVIIGDNVTNIGNYTFEKCKNLTSVTIPQGVTSIGNSVFGGCTSLTNITIPKGVASIGKYAFSGCSNLTNLTIPEGVTSIGEGAFYNCSSISDIFVPESVTHVGENAFNGTAWYNYQPEGMVYVDKVIYKYKGTIPANVPIVIKDGTKVVADGAFSYCNNLTDIIMPKSLTGIGNKSFRGCSSLTNIIIPESVTNIGVQAFDGCCSLTSITLPENVSSIGDYAFRNCSSLTSITCEAINPPTIGGSYTFYGVNKSISIYVPESSVSAYQSASYWKDFANIIGVLLKELILTISEYGSGTYCSEYALDFSEVEGLKAYAATGYDSETGVVTLTRVMTAKAGMGLFVKGEPGDYVVPTLESTSFNTLNMLVGTLEDVIVNGTDGLYTNYKYAAPDGEPLFYQFADGSTQKAGRAYLQIPTSWLTTTAAKSISYRFDDGETTDIENSEITTPNSEFIYDLYGRRVENPVKGGVYIVKGKKIVY